MSGSVTSFLGQPDLTAEHSTPGVDFVVMGIDVDPAVTYVGVAIADEDVGFASLNRERVADFFVFNRAYNQNGTFFSTGGNLEAEPPYFLDTPNPVAQLTVSGSPIPEPTTLLLAGSGLLLLLGRRR